LECGLESRGIFLVFNVPAVREIGGSQTVLRSAGMQIFDIEGMRLWTTSSGTHQRLFAACKQQLCAYSFAARAVK